MDKLCFVLWMVLFPISVAIVDYINFKIKGVPVEDKSGYGNLILVIIWLGIGFYLLKDI